jgi:hypothetical protein
LIGVAYGYPFGYLAIAVDSENRAAQAIDFKDVNGLGGWHLLGGFGP